MCISNGSSAMITHGGRGDCQESNPYVNLNRNGTSSGKTSYILYFRQLTEFLENCITSIYPALFIFDTISESIPGISSNFIFSVILSYSLAAKMHRNLSVQDPLHLASQ